MQQAKGWQLPGLPPPGGGRIHRTGFYHAIPVNLCGDNREELVLWDPTATDVYIYTPKPLDKSAYHGFRTCCGRFDRSGSAGLKVFSVGQTEAANEICKLYEVTDTSASQTFPERASLATSSDLLFRANVATGFELFNTQASIEIERSAVLTSRLCGFV